MISEKAGIKNLVEICVQKGIEKIIISPGSRNAPLILAFSKHPGIECLSIVDERSAAFFALGIAQQSKKTVAIACTSGTATLNFAPAIAEAFYQKIPLLVLTADRPVEWIDQADSQTIKQNNIFSNYIKKTFQLPQKITSKDDIWYNDRIISEAINTCQFPDKGPVHINIPFTEPLYEGFEDKIKKPKIIETAFTETKLSEKQIKVLAAKWNKYDKKLILTGLLEPSSKLNQLLANISQDETVAILTETTSNLNYNNFLPCIDRIITTIFDDEKNDFQPELLITLGSQIISKKIKAFLRKNKAIEHWHINPDVLHLDTYQCLTKNIPLTPVEFFSQLTNHIKHRQGEYFKTWKSRDIELEKKHEDFLSACEFSDMKVFETILKAIPENSNLQMGNSTPVRYIQLFKFKKQLTFNCNRGTSGIDGTVSTAAGAAFSSQKLTTLIVGDLGFFYDSNGLWNKYVSKNLKVIIINNGGGGIFRFIDGPSETEELEEFFVAEHNTNAENIAKTFNVNYFKANNQNGLKKALVDFYKPQEKAAILEINTPQKENAIILKNYFKHLKEF
jgi:2-succinyl-5-enolpyruvyl-6-hydroxy-3-cyclohexene-1-carboxylate synthase